MAPSRARMVLLCSLALLGAAALLGRRWIALGWNALNYPTAALEARTQVVVHGRHAYVAAGGGGLDVFDLATRERQPALAPVAPADRIDDLAVDQGRLFALDATPPGHLMSYSLADPARPKAMGAAMPVAVGPFSGVSAAAGLVAVSGGTSQLTLREVDREGRFGGEVATADFGRGQPDVALRPDGTMAVISTHFFGPEFGITVASIERRPLRLRTLGELRLKGAGFTEGGFKPAHFPIVAAWHGDRLVVAAGGGLSVVDVSNPGRPRLLMQDQWPQPAIDLAASGGELDLLRAGSQPAVFRYRFADTGLPAPTAIWKLPVGRRPAAIARYGADAVVTQHEQSWQIGSPDEFSALSIHQP